ncbi:MAG: hypothetical protein AAF744_08335 [Pseudomonadota bacterium]
MGTGGIVLILGSGPSVTDCQAWPRAPFDRIVAINNAWSVRPDWDDLVFPEDFAPERRPATCRPGQRLIEADAFVPAQNRYGGFVFAGATMAFTAGYWALDALAPRVMAFLGCDMVYPKTGNTHFYGTGTADPLRADVTLRDLGAKSARLGLIAAAQGCACVNLSLADQSALLFPRARPDALAGHAAPPLTAEIDALRWREKALGYATPTGRYPAGEASYDIVALDALDLEWRDLWSQHAVNAGDN